MGFEFNKCCFCIDLRTGCLIIGYLNLIANLVVMLVLSLGLVATGAIASGALNDKDLPSETNENIKTVGAFMLGIFVVTMVFLILFLAFTIVLLVGLHQYKRGHVKAYLIFSVIFVVLSVIMFFVSFGGAVTAGVIVRQLFTILLNIYFLLVIRSYYLKMDNPANKPAIYNTA